MFSADNTIVTVHVFRRMNTRNISFDMVLDVVNFGEVLKEYPEDKPYPSKLVLGYVNEVNSVTFSVKRKPLHVVYSVSPDRLC